MLCAGAMMYYSRELPVKNNIITSGKHYFESCFDVNFLSLNICWVKWDMPEKKNTKKITWVEVPSVNYVKWLIVSDIP